MILRSELVEPKSKPKKLTPEQAMKYIIKHKIEVRHSDIFTNWWTVKKPPYSINACQGKGLIIQIERLKRGETDVRGIGD